LKDRLSLRIAGLNSVLFSRVQQQAQAEESKSCIFVDGFSLPKTVDVLRQHLQDRGMAVRGHDVPKGEK
jgi:hypothetical protein